MPLTSASLCVISLDYEAVASHTDNWFARSFVAGFIMSDEQTSQYPETLDLPC
jgi:hypothetical protein